MKRQEFQSHFSKRSGADIFLRLDDIVSIKYDVVIGSVTTSLLLI